MQHNQKLQPIQPSKTARSTINNTFNTKPAIFALKFWNHLQEILSALQKQIKIFQLILKKTTTANAFIFFSGFSNLSEHIKNIIFFDTMNLAKTGEV